MRFTRPIAWAVCISTLLAADQATIFSNAEIDIDFGGPYSVRIEPGSTVYRDLLTRPLQTIDFCAWQPQDPEVQQVTKPEGGYLCELHLLHPRSVADWMKAVRTAGEKKRPDRGKTRDLTFIEIHGLRVITWRFQAGKSRLDHYLVLGKKYHYLFISSPYGSNGTIEGILQRTTLRGVGPRDGLTK